MDKIQKKSHHIKQSNTNNDVEQIHYYDFFKKANDIILLLDTKANIIDINNRAIEIYKYTFEEFRKLKVFDLRLPEEKEVANRQFKKMISKGTLKFETIHINKSGQTFPVEVSSSTIKLKNKKLIQSIIRDIRDRKGTKEALLESKSRYHILAENSPVGIFHTDANGVTTYINPRWSEISGMRADKALGNGWINSVHPEDRESLISGWKKKVKDGNISRAEYRFLKKDGSIVWVIGQANPEKDSDGNIICYVGTITDITERKISEELLRKSENKYRNLIETMPEGFYRTTSEGYFIDVNMALVKMLGYDSKEELMKVNIPKDLYIAPEERLPGTQRNSEFIDDYEVYRLRRKDGKVIWLEDYSRYIKDDEGKVIIHEGICHDITERKYAEEELRRNEQQHSLILKSLPVAFYTSKTDSSLATTWISDQVTNLTGYKPDKFTNDSSFWSKNIHPEDYKKAITEYEMVFEKGSSRADYRWLCADGSYRWFSDYLVMTYDENGKPEEAIGLWIDMNERILSEQALMENEERYNAFINTNNDLMFVKDENFKYIVANESTLKFFGKTREELINKTDYDLMDKQSADFCKESDLQTLEKRNVNVSEENVRERIYETTKFPIQLKYGKTGIGAIIRDITERKKIEIILKESETKFRKVFDNAKDAIVLLDGDKLIDFNQRTTDMLGFTKEELMYKSPLYFSPEYQKDGIASRDKFVPLIKNLFQEGSKNFEWQAKKKNGDLIEVELNLNIIFIGGKNMVLATVHEITERKRYEEGLKLSKEKAEEANKLKTNFLANMSHELRTPMTGILGFAEILYDSLNDEENKHMAEVILKGGQRLMNTLNLILDLSRIEVDRIDVKMTKTNLSSIVVESAILFEILAKDKNLEMKTDIDENIFAILDEQLAEQVLSNLIKNSIIYTDKGSVCITAKREQEKGVEYAVIKVIDTGIGIPKNLREIIFEPFRQASKGYSREFEGTGLGLTLAKKYVELMNGTISVISEVGIGSTFIIKFPTTADFVKENIGINNIEQEKEISKDIKENKLLIVEDDENSRLAIEFALRNICEMDFTEYGENALEMVANKKYDVIIMDIGLRGIDGIETVKKIRKIREYAEIPIIAVTAYAMNGDKNKFLESGCTDYIAKPFKFRELNKLIIDLLEKQK
ncbi:MAG: PAS domain S-box protein [Ignavibacteria bacterium]|jgi:PAS domain S-box-containing protein